MYIHVLSTVRLVSSQVETILVDCFFIQFVAFRERERGGRGRERGRGRGSEGGKERGREGGGGGEGEGGRERMFFFHL